MAGKYVDICIIPVPKNKIASYKKSTKAIGKLLLKYGALASRDYVADDKNATKLSFPKKIKTKSGEVLVYAIAEFKSKAHRDQVFKKMGQDPVMQQEGPSFIDMERSIMGGFSLLVSVE